MLRFAIKEKNHAEGPTFEMSMSKHESMRLYQTDKALLLREFGFALEMFCAPYGLKPKVSKEMLDRLADDLDGCDRIFFEIDTNRVPHEMYLTVSARRTILSKLIDPED